MSNFETGVTDEELRWIRSLKRIAAKRPPTLGLWGGSGDTLDVIALNKDGGFMHAGETICMVTSIRIPTGGGDPDWINIEDVERPWIKQ